VTLSYGGGTSRPDTELRAGRGGHPWPSAKEGFPCVHMFFRLEPNRQSPEGNQLGSRPQEYDGGANQAHGSTGEIPSIGSDAFNAPEPEHGSRDVHAAIGGVGSAGRVSFNERQQGCKRDE
jgi:hypothetical protein